MALGGGFGVAVFGEGFGEEVVEGGFDVAQLDAVLGTFGAGNGGLHGGEVEFDDLAVVYLAFVGDAPEALGAVVGFVEGDVLASAASGEEVFGAFFVDGEEAHGGSVFGGHVGDGGAVHDGECRCARPEEFDEFADHFCFAQELGDGEGEVGGGDSGLKLAGHVDADDVGGEEVNGLAEHAGLSLDAADAPADDAQAVDHGGVGVGAHEGVGVDDAVFFEDAFGEVFEVDLVDNADAGGHDFEGVEGLHAPFEEFVAFAVACEFVFEVELKCGGGACGVHLHGVVHDEVHGHEWLDEFGVAVEFLDGGAHGGEVHKEGHSGEVLEDDAGNDEGDFFGAFGIRLPGGEGAHVVFGDALAVAVAQDGFEHDADGDGQAGDGQR